MSELDDVVREFEQDPMSAVIIRLGALAGSALAVCDALDMNDYNLGPEELKLYMALLKGQITKTDEMFELWAILGATAQAEDEGGEDGNQG